MNQERFNSLFTKQGLLDYAKALGEARLLEIKQIVKREEINHAHARMIRKGR